MAKKISREEYNSIKAELEKRHWFRKPSIHIVAANFKRSPQTVLYIQGTEDYDVYTRFKELHNKRKPVSTLGKKVKDHSKRLETIEKLLFASGAVKE